MAGHDDTWALDQLSQMRLTEVPVCCLYARQPVRVSPLRKRPTKLPIMIVTPHLLFVFRSSMTTRLRKMLVPGTILSN